MRWFAAPSASRNHRPEEHAAAGLSVEALWARPGAAAAIGFHLRHIAGVIDRLLSYSRGERLSDAQLNALRSEAEPGDPSATAPELVEGAQAAIEAALQQVRSTSPRTLLDARSVGRAELPSTVLGLLYHAAEHATRHTGQIITTAKIVQGQGV